MSAVILPAASHQNHPSFSAHNDTLINSVVISRVDYCNSLLCCLPSYQLACIQSVLNAVARIICGIKRSDHVKLLRDRLHWLQMPERVHFKLCLMVFEALNHLAPVKRLRYPFYQN